jgi:GxxExxY protein
VEAESKVAIYPEQELTEKILKGVFTVHNAQGCGFLEKIYSNALLVKLKQMGLGCEQEVLFKVLYKGAVIGDYCADLVIYQRVLVELKHAQDSKEITKRKF